jgi:hypothetical protein
MHGQLRQRCLPSFLSLWFERASEELTPDSLTNYYVPFMNGGDNDFALQLDPCFGTDVR